MGRSTTTTTTTTQASSGRSKPGAAPTGAAILQSLQAAGAAGPDDPAHLLSQVEEFLRPLTAELPPEKGLAALGTAKQYAPWLVQFMKLSFELLGGSKPGPWQEALVGCACVAVDSIQVARLAIKGRPLEIELQMYSLVRKLVAVEQYSAASKYGKALYVGVCGRCGAGVAGGAPEAPLVGLGGGEWPPPPEPGSSHDQQAPGLLVCALLNALLCAAEAPTAPEALRSLRETSPALSGIGAWLREMKDAEVKTYGDSLLRCCLKGASRLKGLSSASKSDLDAAEQFLCSVLKFCSAAFGTRKALQVGASLVQDLPALRQTEVVRSCLDQIEAPEGLEEFSVEIAQLLGALVRSCDAGQLWSEGFECLRSIEERKRAPPELVVLYEAALVALWCCSGKKGRSPEGRGEGVRHVAPALERAAEAWRKKLGASSSGPWSPRELHSAYLGLDALRKAAGSREDLLDRMKAAAADASSGAAGVAALAACHELLCRVVCSCSEDEQRKEGREPRWITPHVWSTAAAAAVQAAKLRSSLLGADGEGRVESVTSLGVCVALWRGSSDGRGIDAAAVQWLSGSMHNVGMSVVKEAPLKAAAPMEVAFQAAVHLARVGPTEPDDALAAEKHLQMIADAGKKCCSFAAALLGAGAASDGLMLLARGVHEFALGGWDPQPILRALVPSWLQSCAEGTMSPLAGTLWEWMMTTAVSVDVTERGASPPPPAAAAERALMPLLKALQHESQRSSASCLGSGGHQQQRQRQRQLWRELDAAVGAVRESKSLGSLDVAGAIVQRRLVKATCVIIGDSSGPSVDAQDWLDVAALLQQSSSSSSPSSASSSSSDEDELCGRKRACGAFVRCVRAAEYIERGDGGEGEDDNQSSGYGYDPWGDVSAGLDALQEELLLCRSGSSCGASALSQGWAPDFSLGRRHELWTLVEIASMASLHGRCGLVEPARRLCSELAESFVRGGLVSDVSALRSVLELVPAMCSLEHVASLAALTQPALCGSGSDQGEQRTGAAASVAIEGVLSALKHDEAQGTEESSEALDEALRGLQEDQELPSRTLLVARSWAHLLAAISRHSAGRVTKGLRNAREGFRLAAILEPSPNYAQGAGAASGASEESGRSRLDSMCCGTGKWLLLQLRLCSHVVLGQLCEASDCAEEALSAFNAGLQMAGASGAHSAASLFRALKFDVETKLELRDLIGEDDDYDSGQLEADGACSSGLCGLCECMARARSHRLSGDAAFLAGEVLEASRGYSEAKEALSGVKQSAGGVPGWCAEAVRASVGLSGCLVAAGDADEAVQVLEEALDEIGYDRDGSPGRPASSRHALAEASLLWQRGRLEWQQMVSSCIDSAAEPRVWGCLAERKEKGKRGQKKGGAASSSAAAAARDPTELLGLLLQSYHLGRESPRLRRKVSVAVATLVHPKAAAVFLQLSMSCMVEQQYLSAVFSRSKAAAAPPGEGQGQDRSRLGCIGSLLEPPRLPGGLGGAATGVRKGSRGKAAAKRGTAKQQQEQQLQVLLEGLEVWASEYLESCAELLPAHTSVCAMAVLKEPGRIGRELLLLSRWSPGRFPVLLQVPIQPITDEEDGQENDPDTQEGSSVPDRLECILQASTDLVRNSQGIQTAAQKKNWWKARLELDLLVKDVVWHMETQWFGGLVFLLMGASCSPPTEETIDEMPFMEGAAESLTEVERQTLQEVVRILVETSPGREEEAASASCSAVASLFGLEPGSAESLVGSVEALRLADDAPPSASIEEDSVEAKVSPKVPGGARRSTEEDEAPSVPVAPGPGVVGSRRSQRSRGRMSRMAAQAHDDSAEPPAESTGRSHDAPLAAAAAAPRLPQHPGRRLPVLLVLESTLQPLPWESFSALGDSDIYRSPSMATAAALHHLQAFHKPSGEEAYPCEVDPERTFYMLNPDQDLASTQATFEAWFQQQPTWDGLVGDVLPPQELAARLQSNDLFLYFGHGSGEKHLPAKWLWRMEQCSVALLMGCSSGKLRKRGEFEPMGVMSAYLIAGCPSAIVNLWDVTDRDIDRFAQSVLIDWIGAPPEGQGGRSNPVKGSVVSGRQGSKGEINQVARSLASARQICRMPYLTGAAPVCYGVPTAIKKVDHMR